MAEAEARRRLMGLPPRLLPPTQPDQWAMIQREQRDWGETWIDVPRRLTDPDPGGGAYGALGNLRALLPLPRNERLLWYLADTPLPGLGDLGCDGRRVRARRGRRSRAIGFVDRAATSAELAEALRDRHGLAPAWVIEQLRELLHDRAPSSSRRRAS